MANPRYFRQSALKDARGRRTYLTPDERARFLQALERLDPIHRTLCATLVHTGARPSEAIAVRADHIDTERPVIVLESLKKRRRGIYREVPVPPTLIADLEQVHDLVALRRQRSRVRLWPISRWTVLRRVVAVMAEVDIHGPHATVRGLRHAFGIQAAHVGVPLNLISRWMGHASLETTAIYVNAVGDEELALASRMWAPPAATSRGADLVAVAQPARR